VFIGPRLGFGFPYWPWPYPYGYYLGPDYGYPQPRYYGDDQPQVYIQRQRASSQGHWYYCPRSKAYYPTIRDCPEEWVKVLPRPLED
jgi:hypothetical protein